MQTNQITPRMAFTNLLAENRPQAMAWVTGNSKAPQLSGLVKFYHTPYGGVLVEAEFFGGVLGLLRHAHPPVRRLLRQLCQHRRAL